MKKWLCALLAVLAFPCLPALAEYPDKPITIIAGFLPGSGPDVAARLAASRLAAQIGQPVIVDNKAGASGTIGTTFAARAEPDGYTLLIGSASALTVAPALYKKVDFDPVKSFAPITQMLQGSFILAVRSDLPIHNVAELLAYSKANPGKLNYGSSGNGSLHHLCMEMLKSATGLNATHVPYKGSPQSWAALNAGEVDIICDSMPGPLASLQLGKARAIAVTSDHRLASMPQVATFKEQGLPQVNIVFWYGFLAPAGTPPAIVNKLNAAFAKAFKDPELIRHYAEQDIDIVSGTPEQFGQIIAGETDMWARIIKQAGVSVD